MASRFGVAGLALLLVAASACDSHEAESAQALADLGVIPDFALTDQNGDPFRATELDGKITIASFLFTTCPTICPLLVERGLTIQSRLDSLGDRVQLVSFSVDPDHDTPEVLRAYGTSRGIDFERWTLVTGNTDAVSHVVVRGFRVAMGQPEPRDDGHYDIMHSAHFVLVDAERHVRGYYESTPEGVDAMIADVGNL
jgi:protein SCO1/2